MNSSFKTTENHRRSSANYYETNKEVILAKAREKYRLTHPLPEPDEEAVIKPVPSRKKKIKPSRSIWDAVELKDGIYRRNGNEPSPILPFDPKVDTVNNIKQNELLKIIEGITDCSFTYNPAVWVGEEMECGDSSMCLCSQLVRYNFIITHKPSNKKFIVGSECVKKISPKFHKVIKCDKCRICGDPVLDKRPKHGREGYCSKECMPNKMPFGKHKGMRLDCLPLSYMEWCVENLDPSPIKDEIIEIYNRDL